MKTATARIAAAAIVALIAGSVTALPASAATVSVTTVDGITYRADDTDVAAGATVTGYSGAPVVDIDAEVTIGGDDYVVTAIGDYAFNGDGLTAATIPDSVTAIGSFAFLGNDLMTLSIPSSVISIGRAAFYGNLLTTLTLVDGVTTIGSSAFYGNQLTTLTIPDSVTTIQDFAFTNNDLATLTIGSGVTAIARSVFSGNQLTTVAIPEGVTSIGESAFASNELTTVTIPDSVTTIGYASFSSNQLTSLAIPDSVSVIGGFAFNTNKLMSVDFAGDAPSIGWLAFGSISGANNPLVSFYARSVGFSSPTWTAGQVKYRSQALATVTFDANGLGTAPAPVDVVVGAPVAAPADPTEAGYTFGGWFDAASGGSQFSFTTAVAQDFSLFARWAAVIVPDPIPTPTPTPMATPAPTPTPAASEPSATDANLASGVTADQELANTGVDESSLIWIAGLLIALGATALTVRNRRTTHDSSLHQKPRARSPHGLQTRGYRGASKQLDPARLLSGEDIDREDQS